MRFRCANTRQDVHVLTVRAFVHGNGQRVACEERSSDAGPGQGEYPLE